MAYQVTLEAPCHGDSDRMGDAEVRARAYECDERLPTSGVRAPKPIAMDYEDLPKFERFPSQMAYAQYREAPRPLS